MPLDPNHSYRYNLTWIDQYSGYSMKLVITASSAATVANAYYTDINIDHCGDILAKWVYTWEYDKYRLGLPITEASFEFNLDRITDTNLFNIIANPFTYIADITDTDGIGNELWAGNLFRLYINWSGTYILFYEGTQLNGLEEEYDPDTYKFTVNTETILKTVGEAMSLRPKPLGINTEFSSSNSFNEMYVIDNTYFGTTNNIPVITYNSIYKSDKPISPYYLTPFNDVETFFKNYYADLWKRITRESLTLTIDPHLPEFYEQSYAKTGEPGTKLNQADLYVISQTQWRKINTQNDSNLGASGLLELLFDPYKNYWDYLQDYSYCTGRGFWYNPSTKTFEFHLLLETNTLEYDLSSGSAKLYPHSDMLQRVNVTPAEIVLEDIDKQELINVGSRTANTENIPLIYDNKAVLPSNNQEETEGLVIYDDMVVIIPKGFWGANRDGTGLLMLQTHSFNLYYYGQPKKPLTSDFYFDREVPIKVHEFVKIDFGTVQSDTYVSSTAIERAESIKIEPHIDYITRQQTEAGWGYILGTSLRKILSGINQSKIEGKCYMDNACSPTSNRNPWIKPDYPLYINPNDLAPPNAATFFNGYPTNYTVTKVTIENGIVSFEALGI